MENLTRESKLYKKKKDKKKACVWLENMPIDEWVNISDIPEDLITSVLYEIDIWSNVIFNEFFDQIMKTNKLNKLKAELNTKQNNNYIEDEIYYTAYKQSNYKAS